jgi:dTMP kinase
MSASAHARFISFEGVDGAGKSTHVDWFAALLRAKSGREVVLTREPGGTALGESLRALVLHADMDLETEALLMFADRARHLTEVIRPALERGAFVVCDRFTDSTFAYQGAGRGLPRKRIEALRDWVHPDLEPGTTILFDLDPAVAQARVGAARIHDRFEREQLDFFERVRDEYLRLAGERATAYRVIDGSRTVNEIRVELEILVQSICK